MVYIVNGNQHRPVFICVYLIRETSGRRLVPMGIALIIIVPDSLGEAKIMIRSRKLTELNPSSAANVDPPFRSSPRGFGRMMKACRWTHNLKVNHVSPKGVSLAVETTGHPRVSDKDRAAASISDDVIRVVCAWLLQTADVPEASSGPRIGRSPQLTSSRTLLYRSRDGYSYRLRPMAPWRSLFASASQCPAAGCIFQDSSAQTTEIGIEFQI
jgi:hypothetical protein